MPSINKLIEKYNKQVPRYTSYPPANHFSAAFGQTDYMSLLEAANHASGSHVALYFHIPFCRKICFYCGCNAYAWQGNDSVEAYMTALRREMDLIFPLIDPARKVSQIHFGGGTPNAIEAHFLAEVVHTVRERFTLIDKPEIAVECNPAYLSYTYLEELLTAGFNRFSLGIQDFDPEVLSGVNRLPSALPIGELAGYIRQRSADSSVNLDFIYGLPGQTADSFSETIAQAIGLRPDRLVTFSYAHVPQLKEHQRILERKGLPSAEEKMDMFLRSRALLTQAGYLPIGLDHYVLPHDELNLALTRGDLHRNFQGYCTRRTTGQVYAFGVTAISQLAGGYSQNTRRISEYQALLGEGKLPVEKGLALTTEQKILNALITGIMCNNVLDIQEFCLQQSITPHSFRQLTGFDNASLAAMESDGLLTFDGNLLQITDTGRLFIRNIAALFDPALKHQAMQYSKTV